MTTFYTTTREEVLSTASDTVNKDRNLAYDEPERNFQVIATFFNTYLRARGMDVQIKSHDVAILLGMVKIARIVTSPDKMDHWVDLAGYSACGYECITFGEEE